MANPVTARRYSAARFMGGNRARAGKPQTQENLDLRKVAIANRFRSGVQQNPPALGESITELGARPVRGKTAMMKGLKRGERLEKWPGPCGPPWHTPNDRGSR